MQVTCELMHLMAQGIHGANFDTESTIHRVARDLTSTFSIAELNVAEDFLASLGTDDLAVMAASEGDFVADLYARLGVSAEDQQTIEEVVNCIFEEV